jgi:hypothetical protein
MMVAGQTPTPHELRAALWVARMLPQAGLTRDNAQASYALAPAGGIYRRDDFAAAALRLAGCGLLELSGEWLSPARELVELGRLADAEAIEVLLAVICERDPPVWLFAATEEESLAVEAIPDQDWRTFEAVIVDPARREALLLSLGRKVDPFQTTSLGAQGEDFVVEACRERLVELGRSDLALAVRRVSLVSDQLGYDVVSPTVAGPSWRLEVKTTQAIGFLVCIHLSRNEARVGLSDPAWALVVCWRRPDEVVEIIGWCNAATLASLLPCDTSSRGAWSSAKLTLLRDELHGGLPDLQFGWAA